MSTDKNTSVLIDSLLPDYLDTEGPKFQQFIKAYYEWLETNNQITDRSKNIENYIDVDRTLEDFVDYFRREVVPSIPTDILADKALVYKNIKDLYYAKGSENAYRLLFRILFNEEIDFYYPGDDILRASDGRWTQENTIRLSSPFTGNPENFAGKNIIGLTSRAIAKVNRVSSTFELGVPVYELFLINIEGTFKDTETITTTDNGVSGVIISTIGPLLDIEITSGGAGHVKGDTVSFSSATGSGATGTVLKTTDTSINFNIVSGGSGYIVNNVVSLSGGSGAGASAVVSQVSNSQVLTTYNDTIESFANVRLDTGPTFVSAGSNTAAVSANLAAANISSTIVSSLDTSNVTVGTISSLTFTRGTGYVTLPTASIRNPEIANQSLPDGSGGIIGDNAVIDVVREPGSISQISVTDAGSQYSRSDVVTITNTSRANTENALGAALITGVINYPGSYKDTKGFISWNNRLQDNYFYQDFSYVVKSTKALELYRDLSKKLTHPAGMKLFGEVQITSNINFDISINTHTTIRPNDLIVTDIFIPTVVSANTSVYEQAGSDGAIDREPEVEIPLDISIADVSNYDVRINDGAELEITLESSIQTSNVEITFVKVIEDVTISSSLTFGPTSVIFNITPGLIEGTPIALVTIEQLGENNLITPYQTTTFNDVIVFEQFGDINFDFTIDSDTITSTTLIPTDLDVDMNIGGTTLISVSPSTIVSSNSQILLNGSGTMSNFLIDEISDLQNVSINNYSELYVNAGDGNKIFNGFSTSFDTQTSNNSVLLIRDINNSNTEFTVTVESIQDSNTISITSNVIHSNGDLAIINNGTYFIVN